MDFSSPIDISIPFSTSENSPRAWYVDQMKSEPVTMGDWVGSVEKGASVNFRNLLINPHGQGTHTECVGHISKEVFSVNQCVDRWFFNAILISIKPSDINGDKVLLKEDILSQLEGQTAEAIIIRTLPNEEEKTHRNYSNTNPPYLDLEAALWFRENGVNHLLIDLPSVDREEDGGALAAHKAFWNYPDAPRMEATITEFIYVPNSIEDGEYFLNLQIAPIENDASPSRPVLFKK